MGSNSMMLASAYRAFLTEYLVAHEGLAIVIYPEENLYYCGISYQNPDGSIVQVYVSANNPDMAFLGAYAAFGMNLAIW